MLLNLWGVEEGIGRCPTALAEGGQNRRPSLVAALAAVGFGTYASALHSCQIRRLAAAELCEDAIGLENVPQIDGLWAALTVSQDWCLLYL